MRTGLATALKSELANDAHSVLVTCVQIDLATPVYRSAWNRALSFGGNSYVPDHFTFGDIGAALRPQSPSVTLQIQNLRDPVTDDERPWSQTLNGEEINGVTVTVRIIMTSQLGDSTAQIEESSWRIRQGRLAGNFCALDLGPPYDISRLTLPYPSLRSQRCFFEYKDARCGSVSSFVSCPAKDLTSCVGRHTNAAVRFSQYPYEIDMRHDAA